MAQALGARVTLVTGVHPGYDRTVLAELDLHEVPVASNPRYANSYDNQGKRTQYLLHQGEGLGTLDWARLPSTDVLIVAPAFREFANVPPVAARVVSVSLQGILREVEPDGRVQPRREPLGAALALSRPGTFAFLSDEDTEAPEKLAQELAAIGVTVLLTRGEAGVSLYRETGMESYAAIPVMKTVDPTGAGDCFATAFAIRYAESGVLEDAMRFALVAAALAVEGEGLRGIPARSAIEERLRQVAA